MEWMPAIDAYAKDAGYRVVTVEKQGCSVPDIPVFLRAGAYPECAAWRTNAFKYIATLQPSAIVLAFNEQNTALDRFDLAVWLSGLKSTLRQLSRFGVPILEIGNNPVLREDPAVCLYTFTCGSWRLFREVLASRTRRRGAQAG